MADYRDDVDFSTGPVQEIPHIRQFCVVCYREIEDECPECGDQGVIFGLL